MCIRDRVYRPVKGARRERTLAGRGLCDIRAAAAAYAGSVSYTHLHQESVRHFPPERDLPKILPGDTAVLQFPQLPADISLSLIHI